MVFIFNFDKLLLKKLFPTMNILKVRIMAWKFNSKQLLSKTLNSRMNIIEARAIRTLNIDRKYSS